MAIARSTIKSTEMKPNPAVIRWLRKKKDIFNRLRHRSSEFIQLTLPRGKFVDSRLPSPYVRLLPDGCIWTSDGKTRLGSLDDLDRL